MTVKWPTTSVLHDTVFRILNMYLIPQQQHIWDTFSVYLTATTSTSVFFCHVLSQQLTKSFRTASTAHAGLSKSVVNIWRKLCAEIHRTRWLHTELHWWTNTTETCSCTVSTNQQLQTHHRMVHTCFNWLETLPLTDLTHHAKLLQGVSKKPDCYE